MGDASPAILDRARQRVEELLTSYERPALDAKREQELFLFAENEGRKAGLTGLAEILRPEHARAVEPV